MRLRIPKVKSVKPVPAGGPSGAKMMIIALKKGYMIKYANRGLPGAPGAYGYGGYGQPLPITIDITGKVKTGADSGEPDTGVALTGTDEAGEDLGRISDAAFSASQSLKGINIYYPLIPPTPKQGERVFAYANVKWDPRNSEVIYSVIEPLISKKDEKLIEKTKEMLEERLDIDFGKLGMIRGSDLLKAEAGKILSMVTDLTDKRREAMLYYIQRDITGLGKIEPLMKDTEIEDVSCDGYDIPIFIYHRDPRLGTLHTNVTFSRDDLDSFVMKMAQKCGKMISIAEPLLDASLPDGSRVQVTLGTDIARRGSNFTIRKFTANPLTPTHMLEYKTIDSLGMAYLWLAIEYGKSILISGGTATGKTSMLNSLSLFINQNSKIVSIEDTPELKLPHPHWVPQVARTALSEMEGKHEVSMFDLLKSSLRQRPDRLVVGEVRGKEAFVMFQQIATGHPSIATIHAASLPQLIDRLITPPISLPPSLIENVDVIIFLLQVKLSGRYVRRTNEIVEITGVKGGVPTTKQVFAWDAAEDTFKVMQKSRVIEDIARKSGMSEAGIKSELFRRKRILEWMRDNHVKDYVEVSRIINTYYTNPQSIVTMVEGGG